MATKQALVSGDAQTKVENGFNWRSFLQRTGTACIFLLIVIVASFISSDFYSLQNSMNLVRQSSPTIIMAVGMLFVVLTGGIDLSVGSVFALGGVIVALLAPRYGLPLAICCAVVSGSIVGIGSGALIAYLRLPAFVITLAAMTVARGAAFILTDGQPIMFDEASKPLTQFASGYLWTVPYPVILTIAIVLIGALALTFTSFGRLVKAIGSNQEAVRLSGVRVEGYVLGVYVISGALAAVAGVVSAGRTGIGAPNVGIGSELQVIAAVVIGGASLMGGRGGVINSALGALTLAIIGNIMNLTDVPGYTQQVIMGVVIVIAVVLQKIQSGK
jgi:ribose transport system permease protein